MFIVGLKVPSASANSTQLLEVVAHFPGYYLLRFYVLLDVMRVRTRLFGMSANQGASGFASLRPLATLALVVGSLLASSATVTAQDERDTATARALFEQGVELADKGDWSGAADRFERSDKLRHSPVVAYNLANAWVELGRLVEAAEVLRQIDKDPGAKPDVKKDARALLAQLEPKIATLVVEVQSNPPPDDVRVNDRPLPEAALGVPTPIDPGSVVVTVNDGNQVLWTKRVEVTPGGTERITITLPKQQVEAAPAVVPTPRETAERAHDPAAADPYDDADLVDDEDREFYEEPWVWVGAGVVVAVGVVAAVLLASGGDDDESDEIPVTGTRLTPPTITVRP
jgi:hypothetical protein